MSLAEHVADAKAARIEDELAQRGIVLKRAGRELVGPCPVCGGTDRFGVNRQKQIWNCRGCAKGGDVIALVQHIDGTDFAHAVETLTGQVRTARAPTKTARMQRTAGNVPPPSSAAEAIRTGRVFEFISSPPSKPGRDWWGEARPIPGTLAEKYLASRGITELPPDVDDCLRFHPSIVFGTDSNRATRYVPALIALVRDVLTGKPIGLQRIGLTADGQKIDRMALGSISGGAVMLWPVEEIGWGLVLAEGVETALAASVIEYRHTLLRPIWATVSAGNMGLFPVRTGIDALTVVVDSDEPDQRGRRAGQEAAAKCAERWQAAGAEDNQEAGAS